MARRLVERKVRQAEGLLAEAQSVRKIRPGMWVRYLTYHVPDKDGNTGRQEGTGRVDMVRPGHILPIHIEELNAWVFNNDCAILPRDRWPDALAAFRKTCEYETYFKIA